MQHCRVRLNAAVHVIDCTCHDDPYLDRFCLLSRALTALPALAGESFPTETARPLLLRAGHGRLPSDKRIFMPASKPARALSDAQIAQFIQDGFVRIDGAFPRELAEQGRTILWRDLPCDPDDAATWTRPVIRLGYYNDEPFRRAVNSPLLHTAFDQLVGKGRWWPRADLGTFPVRFPSPHDPGDAGWHVDLSFPGENEPIDSNDYAAWRVNVTSRGPRAADAVPVLRCPGGRRADAESGRARISTSRGLLEPSRRGAACRIRELAADGDASTSGCDEVLGHRRRRHRLSVPPVPGARRPAAPRPRPASWRSRRCTRLSHSGLSERTAIIRRLSEAIRQALQARA